ncbi:MAG: fumarylacetoacetate hydrolase family protein [Deltaproteobacteria bacterium]|nr:fumarylacetoacetate hydrolase family protein [Deltaproteobacteria bacterium]
MKIAQFYKNDRIRLGLVKENVLVPIDYNGRMEELIRSESTDVTPGGDPISLDEVHLAPPLTSPSKIIAIGLNYLDHVRESKGTVPETPLVFSKFPSSLVGHRGQITWSTGLTQKVDFEAELAVIMGRKTRRCPEEEAMNHIFGYTCANDVSARDLQFGDGQWVRGKSLDTFCPLGPWITTVEEIPDPHDLTIKSRLNGVLMQDSNTSFMIFKIPYLIGFLSRAFTLLPGDVILTGTPHGVGAFRDPSLYMNDGDQIEVEIEGIGTLSNTCRTFP